MLSFNSLATGTELMKLTRRSVVTGLGAFSAAGLPLSAMSQTATGWPQKPITLFVPFSAGGPPDILGRMVADRLSERYGQPITVQNRPGGGGSIAMEAVRQSAPDGYTLFTSALGGTVIAPAVNKTIPYKPLDFSHIAFLGGTPSTFTVHRDFKAMRLAELVTMTTPPQPRLAYAMSGVGTHSHLIGELFQKLSGAHWQAVAYRSAASSAVDLVGGHIPIGSSAIVGVSEHIRAGTLRALAVTSSERLGEFPTVPTFAELGYPAMTSISWFGISGPPGLPPAIVDKLNGDIRGVLKSSEAMAFYQRENVLVQDFDPAAFQHYVQLEMTKWHAVAAEAKITVE
jgi:tripartite-type tricarboxylate transporter receptor subunit TctC